MPETEPSQPAIVYVYKVVAAGAWADGRKRLASTPVRPTTPATASSISRPRHQLQGTLAKHFRGQNDLLLVAFRAASLGAALKFEASRGGDLFPHLYRPLPTALGALAKAASDRRRWRSARRGGLAPMLSGLYRLARAGLFLLQPEDAHEATLKALEAGVYPRPLGADDPVLAQSVFGLDFPKSARHCRRLRQGRARARCRARTRLRFCRNRHRDAEAAAGNPKPRVFRLLDDHGLINRLGFNNGGHAAALRRLEARKSRGGIVGVNIGANKDCDRPGGRLRPGPRRPSMPSPAISRSTSRLPTRRACAICKPPPRSTNCSPASSPPAPNSRPPASRAVR